MGLEGREQRALAAVIENDNKPNRKTRKIEIKKNKQQVTSGWEYSTMGYSCGN